MDAIACLKTRRSIRAYESDTVSRDVLSDIVDCARLAPSGRNEQPWTFIVVTKPDLLDELAGLTDFGKHIAHSAACIVVFCKDTKYYLEDGSAATTNICLAAWAHGLGTCWISGDKREYADDVRRFLGVPNGHKLISLISLGVPAEEPIKTKRALEDVLHWERWGAE
ncbi:nitroreductase family protein [Candidatus Poribacteria bacterium]|nr:nitroreductase family protein [Candidatus Poribacteria bacterium]